MHNVDILQTDIFDSDINWVTPNEVATLRKGAKKTRNPIRNELIVLILYRHGLRETELCNLKLTDLIMDESKILIRRIKGSNDFVHPIEGDELRLIRRYLNTRQGKTSLRLPWLFISERGGQLHRNTVINLVKQSSKLAEMRHVYPHMLRHGCGYYLADRGAPLRVMQDYLGHKDVNNTVLYTKISGKQFENLWS